MSEAPPRLPPAWLRALASPNLSVYALAWLMVMVVLGTLAQGDMGLYRAQTRWFAGWWIPAFGCFPLPGAKAALGVLAVGLVAHLGTPLGRKHPGTLLTHGGTLLLLVGGLLSGSFRREGALALAEGQARAQMESFHRHEFILAAPDDQTLFRFGESHLKPGNTLRHPDLPLEVEVVSHYSNAERDGDRLRERPREKEVVGELAGVEVLVNGTLIPVLAGATPASAPEGWFLGVRSARTDLPFAVRLLRFEKDMHPGTGMASAYRSEVEFMAGEVTRRVMISMNRPLRHRRWTLYQQSFQEGEQTISVLAVVEDRFQSMPYLASGVLCLGLLVHVVQRAKPRGRRR